MILAVVGCRVSVYGEVYMHCTLHHDDSALAFGLQLVLPVSGSKFSSLRCSLFGCVYFAVNKSSKHVYRRSVYVYYFQ